MDKGIYEGEKVTIVHKHKADYSIDPFAGSKESVKMEPNLNKVLNRISERWNPSDNLGIAHPILEDELANDVDFLVQLVKKQQKEIEKLNQKAKWISNKTVFVDHPEGKAKLNIKFE
jgi:hypothetical protein